MRTPKKWQLVNLIHNDISEFDYSLKFTNELGNEVTIYDSSTFMDKIVYKYTSWALSSPGFFDTVSGDYINICETIDSAINMFHAIYTAWRNDKLPGFARLYKAMNMDYNPIWNVDGVTGLVTQDSHTGTDTLRKTGTDTSNLSGSDRTSVSGSDVNTLSGRDIDTLSGSDVDRLSGTDAVAQSGTESTAHTGTITDKQTGTVADAHTGTIKDAHTGTIGNVKSGSDTTSYSGREVSQKTGDEISGEEVATFDSGATFHPTKKLTTHYPGLNESNARADILEYDHRTDGKSYSESDTQTLNNTDTRTNNNTDTRTNNLTDQQTLNHTDATTFGKTDSTTYGRTDTLNYGKVDTMQYGKVDTLQHGKVDTTQYGKQDMLTHNTTDLNTKNLQDEHIELQIRQGNIGVTTTQKMLNEQIDLTSRDALIDYMIADFIHTNCII